MIRALALLAVSAAPALPAAAAGPSGLQGIVRRGPTMPVCIAGKPCSAPAPGVRLQFVRHGSVAASVVSGAGGRYRVALRPGGYAVRVAPPLRIGRGIEPAGVTVPRGRTGRVDFMLDTGIRYGW